MLLKVKRDVPKKPEPTGKLSVTKWEIKSRKVGVGVEAKEEAACLKAGL
jgi:hypothetical protein